MYKTAIPAGVAVKREKEIEKTLEKWNISHSPTCCNFKSQSPRL